MGIDCTAYFCAVSLRVKNDDSVQVTQNSHPQVDRKLKRDSGARRVKKERKIKNLLRQRTAR